MTEVTKVPRVIQNDFKAASFAYNEWSYKLSEEQSLDCVLVPEFWRGAGEKVMGFDGIPVRRVDTILNTEAAVV